MSKKKDKEKEVREKEKKVKEKENTDSKAEQKDDLSHKEAEKKAPTQEDLIEKEKDKFLRLFAEFENFKKRTYKERIELFKTASQELMTSLLPVIDDFERALAHIEVGKESSELKKGVLLIYEKLYSTLEQKGLSKIKTDKGDVFDADIHEAITQAPSEDLKGKIIECIEKGYKLGDKVIRYPKVVTGV